MTLVLHPGHLHLLVEATLPQQTSLTLPLFPLAVKTNVRFVLVPLKLFCFAVFS